MSKKLTMEKFLSKSKEVHGDVYNYSLVEYINSATKIKIICSIHGVFEQTPNNHISKSYKCPECKRLGINEFIERSKEWHGNKYDYSLVDYKNKKTKVKIICPKHDIFEQAPENHYAGSGCPKCNPMSLQTTKEFILKANKIHKYRYDYSLVDYKGIYNKIIIICSKHKEFLQTPASHLRGSGCPHCKESKGEIKVTKWLKKHNIVFKKQHTFKDCKNKRLLPFDFYIPYLNIVIEYDGKQHFEVVEAWGGEDRLSYIKKNNEIKTLYCKNKGIKLIRIKYDDVAESILNGIEEIGGS